MFRDPPGVKHINLGKYQRQIRKMLENLSDGPFETFGIISHPLDWMDSWYRYRQRDQLKGHKMRLSTEFTQAILVKKTQKLCFKPRSPANAP